MTPPASLSVFCFSYQACVGFDSPCCVDTLLNLQLKYCLGGLAFSIGCFVRHKGRRRRWGDLSDLSCNPFQDRACITRTRAWVLALMWAALGLCATASHVDLEEANITRWSTPKSDWLYSLQSKMEKLYTVSKNKPGADCGSDHELLIAKFRLKLKKVGKPLDHSGMT